MKKKIKFYCSNFNFFLLIFISSLFCINTINIIDSHKKVIIIPFKIYKPKVTSDKESSQTNLLTSWLRQKTYLDMIDSSGQKLSMILTLDHIDMHTNDDISLISSEEIDLKLYKQNKEDICYYNTKISPDFKRNTQNNIVFYERKESCIAEDEFIFYNNEKLSEKIRHTLKFIHTTNENNICFFASLQKNINNEDKSKSFIDELKLLSGVKSYSWSLKYISDNEGIFIFGDIIDNLEINLDKNNIVRNTEKNFDSIYSIDVFNKKLLWKLNCDELILGDNIILGQNENINIDINIPFILLKKEYFKNIKEKIFTKYFEENICDKHIPEYQLSAISCNKKKFLEKTDNLNNIPSLKFRIKQYDINLIFTPKDLFVSEGDTLYFLIAHHSYRDSECTFGNILLKKYPIVFDDDSKMIKILKSYNYINENLEKNDGNKGSKIFWIIFLCVLLSGLIFGYLGLKYGKKIYQRRRMKANELDDNYDYTNYEGKKDINSDKKNRLFENSDNDINQNKDKNLKGISLEMSSS